MTVNTDSYCYLTINDFPNANYCSLLINPKFHLHLVPFWLSKNNHLRIHFYLYLTPINNLRVSKKEIVLWGITVSYCLKITNIFVNFYCLLLIKRTKSKTKRKNISIRYVHFFFHFLFIFNNISRETELNAFRISKNIQRRILSSSRES